MKHQVEFKITNKDLEDEFALNADHFKQNFKQVWFNFEFVTGMDKPTNRHTGSYPFPGQKEGMYITIAGMNPVPDDLKKLMEDCSNVPRDNKYQENLQAAGYNIDWCSLRVMTLGEGDSDTSSSAFLPDSDKFDAVSHSSYAFDDSPQDLDADLIYVFIPILVGILISILLSFIMCCNREGVEKRDELTPGEQLAHHKSIRRAALQLREMSSKDKIRTPPPNRDGFDYGHLENDYPDSTLRTNSTMDRKGPPSPVETPTTRPPPYRMPPSIASESDNESSVTPNDGTKDSKF